MTSCCVLQDAGLERKSDPIQMNSSCNLITNENKVKLVDIWSINFGTNNETRSQMVFITMQGEKLG